MIILLDRDGVINEDSPHYIKSPDEWLPIPGSLEAIARLKKAGFTVIIATNQSGIARGLYDENILQQIHHKMATLLKQWGVTIDGIFYCPHHPNDYCSCRKPNIGLFLAIAQQFQVNLTSAIFIGDSLTDLQAAERANIRPWLVLTGNGEKTLQQLGSRQVPISINLAAAVTAIIGPS